jgi:hypothetical protein
VNAPEISVLIGGAIGGDTGKGAAIGAATAALMGCIKRRDQARQQTAEYERKRSEYNRAYLACLEAKSYTENNNLPGGRPSIHARLQ